MRGLDLTKTNGYKYSYFYTHSYTDLSIHIACPTILLAMITMRKNRHSYKNVVLIT